ncbi:MAG: hypothetical protein AAGA87_12400 [Pseudomonadota bacterium]
MKRALITALAIGAALPAGAGPPELQTQGAVIYLADNLDEADNLGWCIDTIGRGFAETLQAHSCKPQGGDVQFSYDAESRQIRSVAFDGKCMAVIDPDAPSVPFGLLDCDPDALEQRFGFDAGLITLEDAEDTCVVVGEDSRSAGPFMSRDLTLQPCSDAPPTHATWVEQKG